ncbi:MAG: transglutaminase-like domain-containing protein [candidate division Zixibacteria bacterium]
MKILLILLIVGAVSILSACSNMDNYPENVSEALNFAGDNRAELIRVIDHYKDSGDSLKLQAAYFLIGNMEDHCYVTYRLFDTSENTVEIDPMTYENYEVLTIAIDSIEKTRGELDYESTDKIMDMETVSADFLINQIDLAFTAWREKPWAGHLNFDEFCRYVLPYRGSNEPLEDWRSHFVKKYAGIDTLLENSKDPVEAAGFINKDVRTWFGFDPRYYFHPTDQGMTEMLASGLGRCEDMTNMAIFALRANALAVTSDFTPYWANTGNNHAWNAILTANGTVVPFMGAEADPGQYKLHNKAAKVYRKTFDKQMGNLVFQPNKQDSLPRWLNRKYYTDVTADYMDVCDVAISCTEEIPDSADIGYICVFNSGEFRPIHWGRIEDGRVTFTDMGNGIVYLPASYQNKEIVALASPFILTEDCRIEYLIPDTGRTISINLSGVTKRAMAASTETSKLGSLTIGEEYTLSYWDNGWQTLKEFSAAHSAVRIDELPSGCLYWLISSDGGREERIFTIKDGQQIFW